MARAGSLGAWGCSCVHAQGRLSGKCFSRSCMWAARAELAAFCTGRAHTCSKTDPHGCVASSDADTFSDHTWSNSSTFSRLRKPSSTRAETCPCGPGGSVLSSRSFPTASFTPGTCLCAGGATSPLSSAQSPPPSLLALVRAVTHCKRGWRREWGPREVSQSTAGAVSPLAGRSSCHIVMVPGWSLCE